MKVSQLYFLGIAFAVLTPACNSTKKIKERDAPGYLTISENGIKSPFFASPDSSINVGLLRKHYEKYPGRWDTAFKFLSELDTSKLEFGRVNLSDNVFANFAEYTTKDIQESVYESHKDYIDIQYVISGQEYIAVNNDINSLTVIRAYDKEKDYLNYAYDGARMLLADNQHFFIFFPSDGHMPCVRKEEKASVKKLVVKVRYN